MCLATKGAANDALSDESKRSQGELSYQRRMEQILSDENLFRVVLWHQETETTLAVEMLDTDSHSSCSGENPPLTDVRNWASYVEGYVSSHGGRALDASMVMTEKTRRKNADPSSHSTGFHSDVKKAVFLQRNLKQWERRRRKDPQPNQIRPHTSGNIPTFPL